MTRGVFRLLEEKLLAAKNNLAWSGLDDKMSISAFALSCAKQQAQIHEIEELIEMTHDDLVKGLANVE